MDNYTGAAGAWSRMTNSPEDNYSEKSGNESPKRELMNEPFDGILLNDREDGREMRSFAPQRRPQDIRKGYATGGKFNSTDLTQTRGFPGPVHGMQTGSQWIPGSQRYLESRRTYYGSQYSPNDQPAWHFRETQGYNDVVDEPRFSKMPISQDAQEYTTRASDGRQHRGAQSLQCNNSIVRRSHSRQRPGFPSTQNSEQDGSQWSPANPHSPGNQRYFENQCTQMNQHSPGVQFAYNKPQIPAKPKQMNQYGGQFAYNKPQVPVKPKCGRIDRTNNSLEMNVSGNGGHPVKGENILRNKGFNKQIRCEANQHSLSGTLEFPEWVESLCQMSGKQIQFKWSVTVVFSKKSSWLSGATLIQNLQQLSTFKITENNLDVTNIDRNVVRVVCPDENTALQFCTAINNATDGSMRARVNKPDVQLELEDAINVIQEKSDKEIESHDKKIKEVMMKLKTQANPIKNGKHFVLLDAFEKRHEIEKTLKEKFQELNSQKTEFQENMKMLKAEFENLRGKKKLVREDLDRLKTEFDLELIKFRAALPVYARRSDVIRTVKNNKVSIILGETGSGKSTQLVQYLHESWIRGTGKIVCTQPRKIAAITLATRVAQEMGGKVGQLVGYKVGLDSKMSQATRILYVTDQILLNECLKDPIFVQYSCIIIDEAHERSIFTDLLLGFVRRALVKREDLHVIITSATIDPDVFVNYFREDDVPPVLRISGRTFPVDEFYESTTSEEYMAAACEKAISVHENEPPGDVLVFLATPLETERACEMVAHLQGIMACELNGRLQPQEQQKVFDPTPIGKRKVVFATNSAETSVTIPGVKYVIDTGRVNEVSYDAKKNMSSKTVTWVTQSSANQRKGRAGRTESGKCYRLYTVEEYNGFRTNSVPEIKRVHLGQALLKLFMLGIKDPESFEFVEPPSTDGIQNALAVLRELGAYNFHGITDVGKKLAKLSLEPRLGKAALLGIDKGIVYECLTMCSISSAGGSVFFRAGAEEEKQLADKKKTKFCDEWGDMITFVNCYKEWDDINEKQQNGWCFENSINAKTMRSAKRTLKDILHTFRQDLGIDIKKGYSKDPNVNKELAKIIFECYPSNLCRYSGHQREGYCQAIAPKTVAYIHPSSALHYMEELPKWAVYEQVMTTSKTFMLNVTYVDESWVHEKLAEGRLPICMESIEEEVVERKLICGIGSYTVRELRKNRAEKLRNIKEELLSKFSPHTKFIVDIEHNVLLIIYANASIMEEAFVYVDSFVRELKRSLLKETMEKAIRQNSDVKFVMEKGGNIRTILMKEDKRRIQVKNVSERHSEEEVIDFLRSFGEIEKIDKNYELSNWGIVTFDLPESAKQASMFKLTNMSMVMDISLVGEIIPGAYRSKSNEFLVEVVACRRRVLGFGFVKFTDIDRSSALNRIPNPILVSKGTNNGSKTAYIEISANKKNDTEARLKNIPEWADKVTIETQLESYLGLSSPSHLINVSIAREKPPADELSRTMWGRFRSFIQTELGKVPGNFEITMNQPPEKHFTYVAFVKFSDASKAQQAADILDEMPFNGASIEAKLKLEVSYIVFDNIYTPFEKDIQEEISSYEEETKRIIKLQKKTRRNGSYLVVLETGTLDGMIEVKKRLDPLLNGHCIDLSLMEFMKLNSGHRRKEIEFKILEESNTRIRIDARQQAIILYGKRQNIEHAKQIVSEFLKIKNDEVIRDINLKGFRYPKGITKALIQEYGYNLEQMKEKCDANHLELVLRNHTIKFQGSVTSFELMTNLIDEKAATLPPDGSTQISNQIESFECPICLDSVRFESCYVLQYCGHLYCKECANNLVRNNVTNKDFPIKCAHDKCGERLVLEDFRNLHPRNEFQLFSDAAIGSLVSTHPQQFAFCLTPDCPIVYKKSTGPDGEEFVCSECQVSLCTNCGLRYDIHRGMSCSAYKNMSNTDLAKNTWLADDTINRSLCPNCKTGIEKNGGCSHVACTSCKAHICWKCKQWFQTSAECYGHMSAQHGGY